MSPSALATKEVAIVALDALRHLFGEMRLRRRNRLVGPVCQVTLDLRGRPWGADPEIAQALLRARPGVLDVRVDARRGRALVWHDGQTSFPQLYNWLQMQAQPADDGHQ